MRDANKEQAAPSVEIVAQVLKNCGESMRTVCRVPQGVSTYVYRAECASGVKYARFLPENATFGVEVTAQRKLCALGVSVPHVLAYQPREPLTGRSMMLTAELPGEPLTGNEPQEVLTSVLHEAGRQLRLLHSISVDGFGWVDRSKETVLSAEHETFSAYCQEFLRDDLQIVLPHLSAEQAAVLPKLLEEAEQKLTVSQAVLVHGDFCWEHIFHEGGRFTGFLDFGEIRGCTPWFDLGTFALCDDTENPTALRSLLSGYGGGEERTVWLAALHFALRFAAKKANTPTEGFWAAKLNRAITMLTH